MSCFDKRFGMGSSIAEVSRNVTLRDAERKAEKTLQEAMRARLAFEKPGTVASYCEAHKKFTEANRTHMVAKKASQIACDGLMDKPGSIATVEDIMEAATSTMTLNCEEEASTGDVAVKAKKAEEVRSEAGSLHAFLCKMADTAYAITRDRGMVEKAEQALSASGEHGAEELVLSLLENIEREMDSLSPVPCAAEVDPPLAEKGNEKPLQRIIRQELEDTFRDLARRYIAVTDEEEGLKFINDYVSDLLENTEVMVSDTEKQVTAGHAQEEKAAQTGAPTNASVAAEPVVSKVSVKKHPKMARSLEDLVDLYDAGGGFQHKGNGGKR